MLDQKNIAVSSGSACASGSFDPSHVLLAMGLPRDLAFNSIRFSFGIENTASEVDLLVKVLTETVIELRRRSPLFVAISNSTKNKGEIKNRKLIQKDIDK